MEANQNIDHKISSLQEKARSLLLEKVSEDDVILELTKEGIEPGYAKIIIENVKSDFSDKRNFWIELFKGIGITILGLLLNYLSFITSLRTGALFWILYWGIVVFGVTLIFRAFIIFKK